MNKLNCLRLSFRLFIFAVFPGTREEILNDGIVTGFIEGWNAFQKIRHLDHKTRGRYL